MRYALAAVLCVVTSAAFAQAIGVPECDSFYDEYEACVAQRVPEAQRPTFRQQIESARQSLRTMAGNAQARPQLAATCTQSRAQMAATLRQFGCQF